MSYSAETASHLERAATSLQAAQLLVANGLANDAVSRAYYAAFHGAAALLLSRNLTFKSHTGVLRAISLNLVKPGILDKRYGRDLNWLAELRQTADYGEIRNVSMQDAEEAVNTSAQFLRQVQCLLDADKE